MPTGHIGCTLPPSPRLGSPRQPRSQPLVGEGVNQLEIRERRRRIRPAHAPSRISRVTAGPALSRRANDFEPLHHVELRKHGVDGAARRLKQSVGMRLYDASIANLLKADAAPVFERCLHERTRIAARVFEKHRCPDVKPVHARCEIRRMSGGRPISVIARNGAAR